MQAAVRSHTQLDEEYPLTSADLERYREEGHVYLRDVAGPDIIQAIRPALKSVIESVVAEQDKQGRIDDYSALFTQVSNVWRRNEVLRAFVLAKRFGRIAAELMGVEGVRLYHDQALYKPPGGKQTPWHQDQFYWPMDTENTITMWMPLVSVSAETGTMIFAGGSQKNGQIGNIAISEEAQAFFERFIEESDYPLRSYSLKPGDATFHAGWTLHAAQPNLGDAVREVITIIYHEDGVRILEPDNENRKADMFAFYPGRTPGDLAATELNPLIYSAR